MVMHSLGMVIHCPSGAMWLSVSSRLRFYFSVRLSFDFGFFFGADVKATSVKQLRGITTFLTWEVSTSQLPQHSAKFLNERFNYRETRETMWSN